MRISDWSSDVCSSDLVRPALDRMPGMDVDGVERRTAMDVSTRKEPKSGAEISSEITRLIYANPDVQAYNAQFHIPASTYQEHDESGCNWTVHIAKATQAYASVISQALATARSRYVLKQQHRFARSEHSMVRKERFRHFE